MDYVDWCGYVLEKIIEATDQSTDVRAIGISDSTLEKIIFGGTASTSGFLNSHEREGLHDALKDLDKIVLISRSTARHSKLTPLSREYSSNPIEYWESICGVKLDLKQDELLRTINGLSPEENDSFTRLAEIGGEDLVLALTWASDISLVITVLQELKQSGFVHAQMTLGNTASTIRHVHATLKGLIWDSRRKFTHESQEIDRLVAEWETTSVDFKLDIHLDTKDEEAEFAKDILGLVNTQASGPRRLILGFHPRTHEYVGAPNDRLSQDWIERVLINDTDPMVQAKYEILDYRLGPVGMIEVLREPAKLPYEVKRSIGDRKRITQGQIFVRHSSQTEEPTPHEKQAIIDEGRRTRGETMEDEKA